MKNTSGTQLSLLQILLCGGFVVTLSMGIRHGFGLWLQPITQEHGWTRETFAFAIAVQNIATAGDHIVSSTNLYGGTLNLFEHTLAEQGLSTTFVNPADLDADRSLALGRDRAEDFHVARG